METIVGESPTSTGAETLGKLSAVVEDCTQALCEAGWTSAGRFAGSAEGSWEGTMAFARRVEELSRVVESLQIRAAAAVEDEWGESGVDGAIRRSGRGIERRTKGAEFRNPAECLRGVLRIGISEARRRLALARIVVPGRTLHGEPLPPVRPGLADVVARGEVSSRTATVIALALDSVHHVAEPEAQSAMEASLVEASRSYDQDAVRVLSRRWVDGLHQDGDEPSEEELGRRQGAFVRKAVRGLHHLEIFATTEQFEHLVTVMNANTNPRLDSGTGGAQVDARDAAVDEEDGARATAGSAFEDRRSRAQKLLEGLVGACRVALASGGLPRNGGLRPQVMVTIPYDRLFEQLGAARRRGGGVRGQADDTGVAAVAATAGGRGDDPQGRPADVSGSRPDSVGFSPTEPIESTEDQASPGPGVDPGWPPGTGRQRGSVPEAGSFVFTGPVNARTIRRLACDAELIPVVLGGEGEVLDIGRASRVFPPAVRKALVARDLGCAFPSCTMPATWCEAHHVEYWSRGGPTSVANGVLLCSHHHHVIHREDWEIRMSRGVPWFVPPGYLDPGRTPRRNHCGQRPAPSRSAA